MTDLQVFYPISNNLTFFLHILSLFVSTFQITYESNCTTAVFHNQSLHRSAVCFLYSSWMSHLGKCLFKNKRIIFTRCFSTCMLLASTIIMLITGLRVGAAFSSGFSGQMWTRLLF